MEWVPNPHICRSSNVLLLHVLPSRLFPHRWPPVQPQSQWQNLWQHSGVWEEHSHWQHKFLLCHQTITALWKVWQIYSLTAAANMAHLRHMGSSSGSAKQASLLLNCFQDQLFTSSSTSSCWVAPPHRALGSSSSSRKVQAYLCSFESSLAVSLMRSIGIGTWRTVCKCVRPGQAAETAAEWS